MKPKHAKERSETLYLQIPASHAAKLAAYVEHVNSAPDCGGTTRQDIIRGLVADFVEALVVHTYRPPYSREVETLVVPREVEE